MMDDFDIYADLSTIHAEEEESEKVSELKEKYQNLEKELNELRIKLENLEGLNNKLKTNFSSLFKTAKAEIARKDRAISELRAQLDTTLFRRNRQRCNERNIMPPKALVNVTVSDPQLQQLFKDNFSYPPPPINPDYYQSNQQLIYDNSHRVNDQPISITKFDVHDETTFEVQHEAKELIKLDYFCPKETNASDDDSDDGVTNKTQYRSTVYGERLRKKLMEERENERKSKEEALENLKEKESEKRKMKEEKLLKEKEKEKPKLKEELKIENEREIERRKREEEKLLKDRERERRKEKLRISHEREIEKRKKEEKFSREREREIRKKEELKVLHEREIGKRRKEEDKVLREHEREKRRKEELKISHERDIEQKKIEEEMLFKERERETRRKEEELKILHASEIERRKIEEEKLLKEQEREKQKQEELQILHEKEIERKKMEEVKLFKEREGEKRRKEEELKILHAREIERRKMEEEKLLKEQEREKRKEELQILNEELQILNEKENEKRKIEEEKLLKEKENEQRRQEEELKILFEKENEKKKIEEELKQINETLDKVNNKENLSLVNETTHKTENLLSNKKLKNVKSTPEAVITEKMDLCSKEDKYKYLKDEISKADKYMDTNYNGIHKENKNHPYNDKNNHYNSLVHKAQRNHNHPYHREKHKHNDMHCIQSSHRYSRYDQHNNHFYENGYHRSSHRHKSRDNEKSNSRHRHKEDANLKDHKRSKDRRNRTPKKIKLYEKDGDDEINSENFEKCKKHKDKVKTPKRKKRSNSEEKSPCKSKRRKTNIDDSNSVSTSGKIEALKTNIFESEPKESIERRERIEYKEDRVANNRRIFNQTIKSDKNEVKSKTSLFESKGVKAKDKIESLLEELEEGEILDESMVDEEIESTHKTEINVDIIAKKLESEEEGKQNKRLIDEKIDIDLHKIVDGGNKSEKVFISEDKKTLSSVEPMNEENKRVEKETLISILSHNDSSVRDDVNTMFEKVEEKIAANSIVIEKPLESENNDKMQTTDVEIHKEQNIETDINEMSVETTSKIVENITSKKQDSEKLLIKEREVNENCTVESQSVLKTPLEKKENVQNNNGNLKNKTPFKSLVKADMPVKSKADDFVRTPIDISKLRSAKKIIVCKRRRRPVQLSDSPPVLVISHTGPDKV